MYGTESMAVFSWIILERNVWMCVRVSRMRSKPWMRGIPIVRDLARMFVMVGVNFFFLRIVRIAPG